MNISKYEQRVLHALAGPHEVPLRGVGLMGHPAKYYFAGNHGGRIVHRHDPETGKIVEVDCFNRPFDCLQE